MKLNRKWLNEEFVDLSNVSDKEFVETLTVFGQKVETWERLDAEIKNVVVGKVLSMVRHPNSDHMWICQVDVGGDAPGADRHRRTERPRGRSGSRGTA